jgi:hypothetical protein
MATAIYHGDKCPEIALSDDLLRPKIRLPHAYRLQTN